MASFDTRIVGLDALLDFLKKLPGGVQQVQSRISLKLAKVTEGHLKDRLDNADVRKRSGSLLRSAGSDNTIQQDSGGFFARAGYGAVGGPSARYARAIEEGATIRPKGQLLAMPIGEALTAGGVPRFTTDDGHWLRQFAPDGFWLSRPGHAPLFVRKAGGPRSERLDLIAVGLRSMTITARHVLKKAHEQALGEAAGIIEFETRRALQAA